MKQAARFALREATTAAHKRLDHLYSRFDLGRAEDYGTFLLSHGSAFISSEHALDSAGADGVIAGWRRRRRTGALLEDIAAMHLPPPLPVTPPMLDGEAQVVGAAYVLEGSRLGGALLVRSVGPGLPTAFLTPGNPADWRAFTELLDARLSSLLKLNEAISAALAVFAMFEQSARMQLEPSGID